MEDYKKKYDELLLKLQKAKVDDNVCDERYCCVIDDIVPELKENEDEKIRKALIRTFNELKTNQHINGVLVEDILTWLEKQGDQDPYNGVSFKYNGHTWGMCARDNGVDILLDRQLIKHLEKQGEQKQGPCDNCDDKRLNCHNFPCVKGRAFKQGKSVFDVINEEKVDNAIKVKHKFNEGDWVVNRENKIGQIKALKKDKYNVLRYCIEWKDGKKTNPIQYYTDNYCYLWTLSDVKNGDILYSPSLHLIWIYKDNKEVHAGINMNYASSLSINTGLVTPNDVCPATKEQREQLEKAMADAGYTFDFEKKELKRIEQKSAWSEGDENLLKLSLENLTELKGMYGEEYCKVGDCISWLKSLKQRYTWKPSDKQMDALQYVYKNLNPPLSDKLGWDSTKTLELLYQDLKKLK